MARFLLSALLLLTCLLAAAAPGALAARRHPHHPHHRRRHLRQIDSSIRQENVKFRVVQTLRKGGDATEANAAYGADLGSQNFEKRASWRTYNNMLSTLGRYAKPTDNGARGEVAARRGAKRDFNDSGDIEDANYYLESAAQRNMRVMMVQADMERSKARRGDAAGR